MVNQRMVSRSESITLTLVFHANKIEISSKQRFNTNATKIIEIVLDHHVNMTVFIY
jgi:hypothetical protein